MPLLDDEQLDWPTKMRLAVLAHRGPAHDQAHRFLLRHHVQRLIRRLARRYHDEYFREIGAADDVYALLTAVSPTLALRVVRSTRAPHVQEDEQETLLSRRQALAAIHAALGRTSRGEQLRTPVG
jgi:hypothetical protein